MSFATPWALTGLLLLVPLVLLHLRNRREDLREVPSLMLWHEFRLESASGQRRLRRPTLPLFLLLEALVLILLVAALAGTRISGGSEPQTTVVVVDGSRYMQLPGRLTAAARAIPGAAGRSHVVVVVAGSTAHVTYRGGASGAAAAVAHLSTAGAQTPTAATRDIAVAMQAASGLLTGPHDHIVLIRAREDPAPAVDADPGEMRDIAVGSRVADLGIASAGATCQLAGTSSCEVTATITNSGSHATTARIEATIPGKGSLTQSTPVPAGGTAAVSFLSHATENVHLRLLNGGRLAGNDQRSVRVPGSEDIPRASKVLLVGIRSEALSLAQAFSAVPGVTLQVRTPKAYSAAATHGASLVIFDGWLPKRIPSGVRNEMLVATPTIPHGRVLRAQRDSTVSGTDTASPLLSGNVDLSSLSISTGAAAVVKLPKWITPVVWSPSGPLLAAGDNGQRRVIVMPFQPGRSNLGQLQALPLLAVDVVRWSLGYAPAGSVASGPPTTVDVRDGRLKAVRASPYALAPWLIGAALALLLLEAGCWYWPPARRPAPNVRGLLAPGPVLGATSAILLAVTLAAPGLHVGSSRTNVVAIDRSGSISAHGSALERRWVQHVRSLRCAAPCAPVRFGTQSQTDLQQALAGALAITPDDAQLTVLSDGGQTNGNALRAAALARQRGVRINWVKLPGRTPDVAITSISAPSEVRVGDTIPLSLTVHASAPTTVTLGISHDGGKPTTERIAVRRGDSPLLLLYKAGTRGWHTFSAHITAPDDAVAANNTAATTVHVGPEPDVLVVSADGISPVDGVLASQQIRVSNATPSSLPTSAGGYSRYATIVLDDVPATAMGSAQISALEAAVRTGGAGLLVLGGDHSFSLGRYWKSPLQQILPVASNVPGKLQRRNLAVELVLDHSGSMSDYAGGVPKIVLTRVAARASAKFLSKHHDQLGVIDFDIIPHILLPLETITPGASLNRVDKLISGLQADGGTNIYLALKRGYEEILQSHDKQRHMILMTDGISPGGDYAKLLPEIKASHITVATIALGEDADRSLLKRIAEATGGRAYATNNANNLPKILVKETQLASKPVRINGHLSVSVSSDSPIMRSLSGQKPPPLSGNVVVRVKSGAQADLMATGQNKESNPVLAQWQVGAGRVVAWTPGLSSAWGSDYLQEPELWDDTVRWVQRGLAAPALMPQPTPGDAGSLQINLAALGAAAAGVHGATGTLRDARGHLHRVTFALAAPGLLRANVSGLAAGVYSFRFAATSSTSTSSAGLDSAFNTTGEVVIPYPSEASPVPAETSPLGEVAAQTGGRVLSAADPSALDGTRYDLRAPLLILALAAFLGSVLARIAPGLLGSLMPRPRARRRGPARAAASAGQRQ